MQVQILPRPPTYYKMSAIEPYNFVVVRLCDNDYGYRIKEALERIENYWGAYDRVCPIKVKLYIIEYIIGHYMQKSALDYGRSLPPQEDASMRRYLGSMRVTFDRHPPTDDHDGGSACYDVHQKIAWTF